MRAWLVEAIGSIRLADLPDPQPGPGECLVRVEAVGLNFLDTLMVQGAYQVKPALPFVPGVELIGRILGAGTRVRATLPFGAYAELAVVETVAAQPIDEDLPVAEALWLCGSAAFALYALRERGGLRAGETVLVTAAAGGVGSGALAIAKQLGARVVAAVGGVEKRRLCAERGADLVVDYDEPDWIEAVRAACPGGVDVVLDPVGGAVGEQSLRALGWRGRYLVVGFAAGAITALAANRLLLKEISAVGVLWGEARRRAPGLERRILDEVLALGRSGRLAAPPGTAFAFAEAPEALRALAGRRVTGKGLLLL